MFGWLRQFFGQGDREVDDGEAPTWPSASARFEALGVSPDSFADEDALQAALQDAGQWQTYDYGDLRYGVARVILDGQPALMFCALEDDDSLTLITTEPLFFPSAPIALIVTHMLSPYPKEAPAVEAWLHCIFPIDSDQGPPVEVFCPSYPALPENHDFDLDADGRYRPAPRVMARMTVFATGEASDFFADGAKDVSFADASYFPVGAGLFSGIACRVGSFDATRHWAVVNGMTGELTFVWHASLRGAAQEGDVLRFEGHATVLFVDDALSHTH